MIRPSTGPSPSPPRSQLAVHLHLDGGLGDELAVPAFLDVDAAPTRLETAVHANAFIKRISKDASAASYW
jgi:hypothetical protein